MSNILSIFYIDKNGNIVQLDEILAKQQESPIVPPKPEPEPEPGPEPSGAIIGGREYKTVTIGNQIWLAENLDFKFDGLAFLTSDATKSSSPQAIYYNYDETTYGVNGNKYGLLYNWAAVKYLADRQNTENDLIPGWRVPTSDEWRTLAIAAGGYAIAGNNLKSTTGWNSTNGNDMYGFNAVPTGNYYENFYNIGRTGRIWSITENPENSTSSYAMQFLDSDNIVSDYFNKYYYFPVRLVKNS